MRHRLVFWHNVCYHIVHLFIFFVSNIFSDYFRTLSIWNGNSVFFRRFYSWLSFCFQRNLSSVSFYEFPSFDALVLNITLFIDSFLGCQTYAVIHLENCLFETEKVSFSGDCTADFRFVCIWICRLFNFLSFLLMVLLSWSTTLHYNYRDC